MTPLAKAKAHVLQQAPRPRAPVAMAQSGYEDQSVQYAQSHVPVADWVKADWAPANKINQLGNLMYHIAPASIGATSYTASSLAGG